MKASSRTRSLTRACAVGTKANGEPALPEHLELAAQYDARQRLAVVADRDRQTAKVVELQQEIALHKVTIEAQSSRITALESREQSAFAMRDEAIAERAKWQAFVVSLNGQLRALEAPAAPLIVDKRAE